MKKYVFIILCISFAAKASMVVGLSNRDMTLRSDLVVQGEVQDVKSFVSRESGAIETDISVLVGTCIRGDCQAGEVVTVRRLGGTVGKRSLVLGGVPDFDTGREVLLFLVKRPGGVYSVTGLFQGKFDVSGRPGSRTVSQRPSGSHVVHPGLDNVVLKIPDSGTALWKTDLNDFIKEIRAYEK